MQGMINTLLIWFKNNLDIIFFIYGLSFFIMGVAIWIQPKKNSRFRLGDVLWLLSFFGLLHGLNEWLDMWVIIKGTSPNLDIVRSFVLVVSFYFLFEFSRKLILIKTQVNSWSKRLSGYLFFWEVLVALIIAVLFIFTKTDLGNKINSLARYFLCLPSGILIAYGLLCFYKNQKEILSSLKVKRYFITSALSIIVYSFSSGLIVPKGNFIFSQWLNNDSFFSFMHFPVQLLRAFCAVVIAWSILGILNIFSWEYLGELEKEVSEKNKDLQEANVLLRSEVDERKRREEETRKNFDMQITLNKLLVISLQDISLEKMLSQFIDSITAISWLVLESKGSIFLVENDSKTLIMKAQKGLSAQVQQMCSQVPFGRCYCGRAASSKEVLFSDAVDDRHENRYEGMPAHGHYCVPIISTDKKVLGVLNLYVQQGKSRNKSEKEFLIAIANLLAGIIQRKRSDDSLKEAYIKIQETQVQLIQSEKLKAIGQLASGVAHEIRNPLGIIMQGVGYLKKRIPADQKDDLEIVQAIKESIERADKIVNGILDFSRMTKLDLQPTDINFVLESSLNLIKNQFKLKDIEINKNLGQNLPKVLIDRNKIEQVFINILMNSMQAMPAGGNITIGSYVGKLNNNQIQSSGNENNDFTAGEDVVIVEFIDTGTGISEENKKKIFDPFFTTRDTGIGTGLGLSISLNILKMHKGLINIESQVGKGTKVSIIFKISERIINEKKDTNN